MRYLTIADWGGTPNGAPQMTLPAVAVQVHHSVTTPTTDPIRDFQTLDQIGRSRNHGGISYSWVIHPDGTIGEGQGTRRGAHTGGNGCGGSPWGWNPCSFGICFIGNYQEDDPTDASIDAFRWLIHKLRTEELITDTTVIRGHRDAPGNQTACPGDRLEAVLDRLREPWQEPARKDTTMRMFAVQVPGDEKVWLWWGCYKTHIPTPEVLDALAFVGMIPTQPNGNPVHQISASLRDALITIPWEISPINPTAPQNGVTAAQVESICRRVLREEIARIRVTST